MILKPLENRNFFAEFPLPPAIFLPLHDFSKKGNIILYNRLIFKDKRIVKLLNLLTLFLNAPIKIR